MIENLCGFIDKLFTDEGLPVSEWDQWTMLCPSDVPDQKTEDGVSGNCGAHLSMWAYIIYSSSAVQFSDKDMDCVRKWIVHILLDIRDSDRTAPDVPPLDSRKKKKAAVDKSRAVERNPKVQKWKISKESPMGFDSTLEYCASLRTLLQASKCERYSLRKRR